MQRSSLSLSLSLSVSLIRSKNKEWDWSRVHRIFMHVARLVFRNGSAYCYTLVVFYSGRKRHKKEQSLFMQKKQLKEKLGFFCCFSRLQSYNFFFSFFFSSCSSSELWLLALYFLFLLLHTWLNARKNTSNNSLLTAVTAVLYCAVCLTTTERGRRVTLALGVIACCLRRLDTMQPALVIIHSHPHIGA